jgi:ethanolamine ammonia-lyase small subunit
VLEGDGVRRRFDAIFVIADGLSAAAVEAHAAPLLERCLALLPKDWVIGPAVVAEQARVGLGDEICSLLNADLCAVLIGERPGLSAADSLGVYLTWRPAPGHRDSDRNCLSNIHGRGLSIEQAAAKLAWLMTEARRRQTTGIALKENAGATALAQPAKGIVKT